MDVVAYYHMDTLRKETIKMTTSETLERPPTSPVLDGHRLAEDSTRQADGTLGLHENKYQDDDDNDQRLAIKLVENICVRIVFVH